MTNFKHLQPVSFRVQKKDGSWKWLRGLVHGTQSAPSGKQYVKIQAGRKAPYNVDIDHVDVRGLNGK